jgi:MULE transposase domain
MPLLNILGIDGLDQGFTVGVALLDHETEEDFDWAITQLKACFKPETFPSVIATDCEEALIQALESIFPAMRTKTVICYWHVSMNVLKNCKPYFETEEDWELFFKGFKDCVFAKTLEEFEDIVAEWKEEFHWNDGNPYTTGPNPTPEEVQDCAMKEEHRLALSYCLGRWLGTYKTKVIHAYVDEFFHGGTTTTSRLEGAHHVLKSWIGPPRKNLTGVWSAVKLAINHQLSEIRTHRAQQRSGTRIKLMNEFFSDLRGHITPHALSKLHVQWTTFNCEKERLRRGEATQVSSICTGTYWRSMGIPCWHMIKDRLAEGEASRIQPSDFHPHWHWEKPLPGAEPVAPEPPILDPETRQRRRTQEANRRAHQRQHAAVRRAQTGRILSQHEQMQTVLRHCSACVEWGHDKATCRGCRATSHTRTSCPNNPYSRRTDGPNVQHTEYTENQRQGRVQQGQLSQTFSQQPTMVGLETPIPSSHMGMHIGQYPTYSGPLQVSQGAFLPSTPLPSTPTIPAGYMPSGSTSWLGPNFPPSHTQMGPPLLPQNDYISGTQYPSPTQPQPYTWNGAHNSYYR